MTCNAVAAPSIIRDGIPVAGSDPWRRDRLAEARGILADAAHHRDRLVILACRVVTRLTHDTAERAEAIDLRHLLERQPRQTGAAASATGGAA